MVYFGVAVVVVVVVVVVDILFFFFTFYHYNYYCFYNYIQFFPLKIKLFTDIVTQIEIPTFLLTKRLINCHTVNDLKIKAKNYGMIFHLIDIMRLQLNGKLQLY